MRNLTLAALVVVMGLSLGACAERTPPGPGASPTPARTPTVSNTAPAPTQPPAGEPPKDPTGSAMPPFATDALREHLANQLSVPREQISLLGWQPVTWRDSCLGVHQPQEMCLTVITPGYTFKFQAGATTAVINTNVSGKSYRLAEKTESPGPLPALSWTRTGGLAGTCQNLSVFSTGAYLLRDCKTASILAQGALTGAQVTYLNAQFEQYTSFDWQSELPPGAADMFSDQVIFYGAGSRVMAATEQQKLNAYLAGLAGELENTK